MPFRSFARFDQYGAFGGSRPHPDVYGITRMWIADTTVAVSELTGPLTAERHDDCLPGGSVLRGLPPIGGRQRRQAGRRRDRRHPTTGVRLTDAHPGDLVTI